MSALNRISMAIAGLFGTGAAATPLANRNWIVDGACEYVLGGSSALSGNTSSYTANVMWLGGAGTGGVASVTNQSARTNGLGGDSGTNGLYAHSQTTASTGSFATFDLPCMFQRTEFVNKLAGKSVTLSMKLFVSAGSITVPGVLCRQGMGTGGSPSSNTTLDKAVSWNVTTTQKKFSVRLDLPSVSGLTLGTASNDFTSFGVFFPAGWTGTIYVTEVQVEVCSPRASNDLNGAGGLPTAFEYRGWQAEYARIQRYFEIVINTIIANGSGSFGGDYRYSYFHVPKRAAPAVVGALNSSSSGLTLSSFSIGADTNAANTGFNSVQAGGAWGTLTLTCDARL